MPHAAVNGLNMYYEVHGDGSPLLLLHGGLGSIPQKWVQFFAPHSLRGGGDHRQLERVGTVRTQSEPPCAAARTAEAATKAPPHDRR
ncbi:MAG: hypothetical protein QOD66_4055 [Solirubrobacteraceae bacterium]|nr:hypothetical protein [Solirubrobacteraceae bacterium]